MQASTSFPTSAVSVAPRFNRRVVSAAVIVVLAHAALIAGALLMPDKDLPKPKIESAMTVQLISEPAPKPVAVESKPTPTPPKPVPKPTPKPRPVVKPTPTPLPVAQAPSTHAIEAPTPAPPAPVAPPAPPAPPAPRPTLEIAAPKGGASVSCQIVKPDYPTLSKRRGETGTAMVRFVTDIGGQIGSVSLAKSSGFQRLDDAALDAARSSTCKPYKQDGQAMRASYTVPFNFTLDD
ncbi:MAG: TonB family protein [Burkholderia gladioli]